MLVVMLGWEDEHSLHPVLMMPSYKSHVWEDIYKPTAPWDAFTVLVDKLSVCVRQPVFTTASVPCEKTLTDPVLLATVLK